MKICENCNGTGQIECPTCDGHGTIVNVCNLGHEHEEECDDCCDGRIECDICYGEGKVDDEELRDENESN